MFEKTKEELIGELNHIFCCYKPGGFAYLNETRSFSELNIRLHEIVVEVGRLGFCVRHNKLVDMTLDEARKNACYLVEVSGLADEVIRKIGDRIELTHDECCEIIPFINEFSSIIPLACDQDWLKGEMNMKWLIECKKFVLDDLTLEWKIVPMTMDFLSINSLEPDTWEMEDGVEVPVFRIEYVIACGSEIDEMVSYILTDFKISKG